MPRDITVQFADGTSHIYAGAPDDATPEQVYARASKDFANKKVVHLDGGRGTGAKAVMADDDTKYAKYLEEFNKNNSNTFIPPGAQRPVPMSKESFLDWRNRPGIRNAAVGAAETAINTAGGIGGMLIAPVGAAMAGVHQALGGDIDASKVYDQLLQNTGTAGTSLAELTGLRTSAGDKFNEALGGAINNIALPIGTGLGVPHRIPSLTEIRARFPERASKPTVVADPVLDKIDQHLSTPAPQVSDFEANARALAESRARDEATVARLQAAVDKQNPAQPTIEVGRTGTAFLPPDAADLHRAVDEQVGSMRQTEAQRAIEERQRAMEQEVARQAALDRNAAERARQEQAPTGYAQHQAEQAVREAQQTHDFLSRAKQSEIDATPHGDVPDQFGSTLEHGRPDENGIPIRSDLSMEAQNVQNPLQRNLWGDELAGKANTLQGRSLTQAIDRMPSGPERDAAIAMLAGQNKPRRGGKQSGGFDYEMLPKSFRDFVERWTSSGGNLSHVGVSRMLDDHPVKLTPELRQTLSALYPETAKMYQERIDRAWQQGDSAKAARFGKRYDDALIQEAVLKHHDAFGKGFKLDGQTYDAKTGFWAGKVAARENAEAAINVARRKGGKQSGAIDLKTLEEGFEKLKTLPNGVKLRAFSEGDGQLNVIAHDANGKYIGGTRMSPENYRNPKESDFMSSLGTDSSQRGLATEMYKFVSELGNDIVPSKSRTPDGKAMWDGFERKGISSNGMIRGQRGGLNIRDITAAAEAGAERITKALKGTVASRTDADKVLGMATRDDSFVARPMDGDSIVAKAAAEEPKKLFTNTQSGAVSAGDKAGSTVLRETGRWLNWANSMTKKLTREHVVPVERNFSRLSEKDLEHVMQIAMKEDAANKRLTPEQLREAGVSDKAIEALTQFRQETDVAINRINELNKALGRKEVTSREAYFSSQFTGDYKIPVISKDGKRVLGFATAHSMGEAKKALAWIEKNMPEANARIVDRRDSPMGRAPKDVTNLYQTLLDVFKDSPMGAELQQLMEQHSEIKGFAERGFWKHFEEKSGVRFFVGDRPWLSAKENAAQAATSQVRYLKDVYNWIPTQEMMVEMKKVLNNEQLLSSQPETVALAHGYVDNYLGNSKNVFKLAEDAAAQLMGQSTGRIRSFLAGMKTMTYWMQLGFSGGYMLATPLQMLPFGTAFHMQLSKEGIKHNPFVTTAKAMRDANYAFQIDLGQKLDVNWSNADRTFANDAIRYMEDNGVNNKSLRDEYASLGSHPMMDATGKIIDKTITSPDYVSRTIAFLSFAHHLRDGAPSMPQLEVFRKAAELTEKAAVPLERHSRPLMFDKMGMAGELMSMYKAPVFQFWNNLAELGSHGMKTKDWKPFAAALIIAYGLGGVSSIPGFGEADSAVELIKDMNAKWGSKALAVKAKDFGLKTWAMSHLGEVNTYGALSSLTNTAMSSRFSPQGFDFQKPLNVISPVIQEGTEWAGVLGAAKHRDLASVQQGVYDAFAPPMAKGLMENTLDNFQGKKLPNGRTQALKAADIRHPEVAYDRTPGDRARRYAGLYSLEESKTKEIAARGRQDDARMGVVREKLGADIAASILKGRSTSEDVKLFAEARGEAEELSKLLDKNLMKAVANPQQREMMKANLLREFETILRNKQRGVAYN